MDTFPDSIKRLINEFSRFPGIGKKTAQRMAFFTLNSPKEQALRLSQSIIDIKDKIVFCNTCNGITEQSQCVICSDNRRDHSLICVVESPSDVFTFEKTNSYNGMYHVLGGILSPLDGIGPEDLSINILIDRIKADDEIIIATNATIEGDATSLYLAKLLENKSVTITRLARGLPMGGDLEYIDEATIMRAMEARVLV